MYMTVFYQTPKVNCYRAFCSNALKTLYDVIVIGGGHAGVEACCAAARMGVNTLLVTHKKETIGEMSCNPSFGGIGKGHLMKEIDALDGVCPRICDESGIHYKILNKRKGPAVWGYRAQIDRKIYKKIMQNEIFNTTNLTVITDSVENLIMDESQQMCKGIITRNKLNLMGKTVILTTGTFLNGKINIGLDIKMAGRIGDESSTGLANKLANLKFRMGRLKTGTPPRLKKNSINFKVCTVQQADNPPMPFSFINDAVWIKAEDQLPCFLTYTNPAVGKIILDNLHLNNHIKEEVTGPRYCPSIESKFLRFKNCNHQIWLEPEGFDSDLTYPAGLSCTLPPDLQVKLIREIRGLENAELVRPGYGVEYDYIDPRELNPTLETIKVKNLFFAGQINGTTGYEEAAAQGIIAGINAAAKCLNKPEFVISRGEGYIGVLIDDLTTQGTIEPYRMFTSRSEFRLYLRPDNADLRLTKKGYEIGCVSQERYKKTCDVEAELKEAISSLKKDIRSMSSWRKLFNLNEITNPDLKNAFEVINVLRKEVPLDKLITLKPETYGFLEKSNNDIRDRIKIESLYENVLMSQEEEVAELKKEENMKIPTDIDYSNSSLCLRSEVREKLESVRPSTIAAATRISGVTPSAIVRLMQYLRRLNDESTNYNIRKKSVTKV